MDGEQINVTENLELTDEIVETHEENQEGVSESNSDFDEDKVED